MKQKCEAFEDREEREKKGERYLEDKSSHMPPKQIENLIKIFEKTQVW